MLKKVSTIFRETGEKYFVKIPQVIFEGRTWCNNVLKNGRKFMHLSILFVKEISLKYECRCFHRQCVEKWPPELLPKVTGREA